MASGVRFKVKLDGVEGSSVAALTAPKKVMKFFAARGRVAVRGTINGFPFRSSLMPMGGCHRMVVNKTMRDGAGVAAGDTVDVVMERDREERTVETPDVLSAALAKHTKAQSNWDKLAFTHKKEMARWIVEAKKDETRTRRVTKVLEVLKAGTKWTG